MIDLCGAENLVLARQDFLRFNNNLRCLVLQDKLISFSHRTVIISVMDVDN